MDLKNQHNFFFIVIHCCEKSVAASVIIQFTDARISEIGAINKRISEIGGCLKEDVIVGEIGHEIDEECQG